MTFFGLLLLLSAMELSDHWLLPLLHACVPEVDGGNSITMQYTTAGTFTLAGFTPAISYSCSISARNSQGSGPATHRVVTTLDDGKSYIWCAS